MANNEINVPSLVLILVVSGFLIRHFFFRGPASPSSSSSDGASSEARAGHQGASREQRRAEALDRRTEAAVEHIQQIFPYADRREVWWDLRRNGLNVAATTERILAGRLDTPPITFQPPAPPTRPSPAGGNRSSSGAAPAAGTTATSANAAATASKSSQPSLIQRYHLENQVAAEPAEPAGASPSPASSSPAASGGKMKSWSSNREERQAILKKRRDEMILEARRKMEAKIAAEKAAAEKTTGS